MQKTTELTNFTICTPPDVFVSESTKIGVFGFGPGDFYNFLNAVPLKEKTVIFTIPTVEEQISYMDWTKKSYLTLLMMFSLCTLARLIEALKLKQNLPTTLTVALSSIRLKWALPFVRLYWKFYCRTCNNRNIQ